MTAYAFALDLEPVDHGSPERALWCAALALMLSDARIYHRTERDPAGSIPGTGRRALSDVLECGTILRRLCEFADVDAAWVSEQFARSLQS
jgi:hypothetical protein